MLNDDPPDPVVERLAEHALVDHIGRPLAIGLLLHARQTGELNK